MRAHCKKIEAIEDERIAALKAGHDPGRVERRVALNLLAHASTVFTFAHRIDVPAFLRLKEAIAAIEADYQPHQMFVPPAPKRGRPKEFERIENIKAAIAAAVYERHIKASQKLEEAANWVARNIPRELASFIWNKPTIDGNTVKRLYERFQRAADDGDGFRPEGGHPAAPHDGVTITTEAGTIYAGRGGGGCFAALKKTTDEAALTASSLKRHGLI